jgi:hypothetical protein
MEPNSTGLIGRKDRQAGITLLVVLSAGVVIGLVLMFVLGRSGRNRVDTVKNMKSTKEFYLADAGFNYIKTRVTVINREGGAKKVGDFLDAQKGADWQKIAFSNNDMGYYRLKSYTLVPSPLSAELEVQGTKIIGSTTARYETVQGVLRAPSLARYARYVEGNSTLSYTSNTVVDGEILVAGDINLIGPPVKFTRLVSVGGIISNRPNGNYTFGFREKQTDIPTLNHVHVNSWDNYRYDGSKFQTTFMYLAQNGGIHLFGNDNNPQNPSWSALNSTAKCHQDGPCDTLFTSCYDTLSSVLRSPVVVAGSAVAIDLSTLVLTGADLQITVHPVVYDAGGDGKDYFTLGTPARTYRRNYNTFRNSAVIYFAGDVYLTGKLKTVPVTIVAGDDVFLYGSQIGPDKTEVDGNNMPVTLGVIAQDRVYIHESSSRDMLVRAAILAENDEIIFDQSLSVPDWKYGYVCKREIFGPSAVPAKGVSVPFSAYINSNFIWDDNRTRQSGFGREPEEECLPNGTNPNGILDQYGFVALSFPRTLGAKWKFAFEGSLITRQPGSKGPVNDCSNGWDCDSDPMRTTWAYDDNLGVAYPPKFPAPVVDDRNPSQIIGYKRKSF